MRIVGIILAGGEGSRMGGRDKALLRLAGWPLLARVRARLSPQVAAIALSANGDPGRFASVGVPVLADAPAPGGGRLGPLAGVLAGLDHAAETGGDAIVTVAVDTPFFPVDLVTRLRTTAARVPSGLAIAATDRPHPTFGLWPLALRPELRAALARGDRRIGAVARDLEAAEARFDRPAGGPDPFFNINRSEDLAHAEHLLATGEP